MAGTSLLLIDAFNLIRRIYEARPGGENEIHDVIESSKRSVARALRRHEPTHACVAFDSHDKTWRHLLYPDYKANRSPTPAPLMDNLASFRDAFAALGVKSLKVDNYEADDSIATLAVGMSRADGVTRILSTDRAYLQLLSNHIRVFNHFEDIEITPDQVQSRFGVPVASLVDLWAMAGDPGNNIKGVPRIGNKTAAQLLERYGSLEEILNTEDDHPSAVRVRAMGDVVQRCKQLVTLKTDVELGLNLKSLRLSA